jgi:hypothetical protein
MSEKVVFVVNVDHNTSSLLKVDLVVQIEDHRAIFEAKSLSADNFMVAVSLPQSLVRTRIEFHARRHILIDNSDGMVSANNQAVFIQAENLFSTIGYCLQGETLLYSWTFNEPVKDFKLIPVPAQWQEMILVTTEKFMVAEDKAVDFCTEENIYGRSHALEGEGGFCFTVIPGTHDVEYIWNHDRRGKCRNRDRYMFATKQCDSDQTIKIIQNSLGSKSAKVDFAPVYYPSGDFYYTMDFYNKVHQAKWKNEPMMNYDDFKNEPMMNYDAKNHGCGTHE